MKPFADPKVKAKFELYPPGPRKQLLALRELVFRTAEVTSGVGEIEESLKWGEPAYATKSKSGSTVRMDWKPQREHAQIVEVIRAASSGEFKQFFVPGGVGFVYDSEELPWNLSFSKILHTGDTRMIVEIGEKVLLEGYGAAEGWLNTRRPRH